MCRLYEFPSESLGTAIVGVAADKNGFDPCESERNKTCGIRIENRLNRLHRIEVAAIHSYRREYASFDVPENFETTLA